MATSARPRRWRQRSRGARRRFFAAAVSLLRRHAIVATAIDPRRPPSLETTRPFFFHFYLFSFFGSYRVVYRISLAHVDLTDVPPFSFLFLLCVCVCVCFSQVRKTVRKGIDWWSDVLHARDNATARWAPPSCSWAREKKNKKQNKTWYSTSFFSGFPSSRTGFRWSLPGFGLFFRVLLGSSDTEGALDLGAFDLNSARRCRCVAISSRRPRSRNQTFWWEPPILPFLFCFF